MRSRLLVAVTRGSALRLYYASDIHGSESCWRKFLNAGSFYRVDVLILGGDVVGKAVVPLEMAGEQASATFLGRDVHLDGEEEIRQFERDVRDSGFYPYRVTTEELRILAEDQEAQERVFEKVARRELERWMEIAREKMEGRRTCVYVMAGNDDPWFVDEIFESAKAVTLCDDRVIAVDEFELLSLSYSNITPWNSARELDEDSLFERIERLAGQLDAPANAIFNLHAPPYDSGLDEAPLIDETFTPRTHMGQVEVGPVGSTAVRRAIEHYQPLLGLHGHIHESRGVRKIGRTVVVNPGSEYTTGRIHGVLCDVKVGKVRSAQLVIG